MTGFAEVENGILARLKAAGDAGAIPYLFRTLESYPEEFDTYLKEKIKGDKPFPAAWVVFGGWRAVEDQGSTLQTDAVFMVVVAAQNLRNEKAQRQGVASAGEVGSYQLVQDVSRLIHDQHLGLDIGVLKLGPCRSVRPTATITDRKLSVFALEFSTRLPIELGGFPAAALDDFTTFHANWDLPPFGGVDADPETPALDLPADDAADASDHVELDQ